MFYSVNNGGALTTGRPTRIEWNSACLNADGENRQMVTPAVA